MNPYNKDGFNIFDILVDFVRSLTPERGITLIALLCITVVLFPEMRVLVSTMLKRLLGPCSKCQERENDQRPGPRNKKLRRRKRS